MNVENQDGRYVGKIKNIIVDLSSGDVPYVLIRNGGFMGFGGHTRIVPAVALIPATVKRGIASVDIPRTLWEKLPSFKKEDLLTLGSEERRREIFAAAGIPVPAGHPSTAGITGSYLSPTGPSSSSNAPTAPAAPALHLVTDIVGREVITPQHQPIGEITDLLIDFSGKRPPFAILSADRLLDRSQSFAVPLRSLKPGENEHLILDATKSEFETALPFTEKVWQNANSGKTGIYLYQETEQDNTGLNARDEFLESMTPIKQSERKSDLQLTRKIRRAVVKDPSLSFTAKNIKIVTDGGRVFLRGPVTRESEKQIILRLARQYAAPSMIQDQLEVTP